MTTVKPEVIPYDEIDVDIRETVRLFNTREGLWTWSSCSGHEVDHEMITRVSGRTYANPYIDFKGDKASVQAAALLILEAAGRRGGRMDVSIIAWSDTSLTVRVWTILTGAEHVAWSLGLSRDVLREAAEEWAGCEE